MPIIFTHTCRLAMRIFVVSASAVLASSVFGNAAQAEPPQAANPPSASSLAGNQREFDAGVRAYDAGDVAAAFGIWLPLAKAGDLAAQRNIAHLLRQGIGVEKDPTRALWFYERAARGGLASAALNAGVMRLENDADYFDEEKAAEWLALASSAGSPIAQWKLAQLLENSDEVPHDAEAALILIKTAAEAGHEEALARLEQLDTLRSTPAPARPGPPPSLVAPPPADARPLTAATAPVSPETGAAFMRGVFQFEEGAFAGAAAAWRPLAAQGVVEAQYRLGRLYQFGMGVPRDAIIAREWLNRAKSGGHTGAAAALGALPATASR